MTEIRNTYDIAPDPTLMEDIGATSFTVAEAIAELVANSIDARPTPDSALAVDITVGPDNIEIVDNGTGMSAEILAEAVRLGVKMDQISGNVAPRKGMFGLGLKTAAASLGRHWEMRTRQLGADLEHSVVFDLSEWRRNSGNRAFKWSIDVVSRPPDLGGPLGSRTHGTAIVIRDLRERNPMAGPVLEKLGQAYKPNLLSGDEISVNRQPVAPPTYDYFEESRLEVDLPVEGNRRITGWVALDKRTHNDGAFGINLYRQGQLIEPWNKSWFRAHLMTSRIIGEVHLDFVQTNYFKRGFETQSVEWKLATATMRDFLKPLVRASGDMARGRKDPTRFAKALQGLERAAGKVAAVDFSDGKVGDEQSKEDAASGSPEVGVASDMLHLPTGSIRLVYEVGDLSSDLTPWDYVYDEDAAELQAVLNTSSKLYLEVQDQKFLGMLALADCVASFLSQEKGYSAGIARDIRDRWIYAALAER
jgi:hypothetical protein